MTPWSIQAGTPYWIAICICLPFSILFYLFYYYFLFIYLLFFFFFIWPVRIRVLPFSAKRETGRNREARCKVWQTPQLAQGRVRMCAAGGGGDFIMGQVRNEELTLMCVLLFTHYWTHTHTVRTSTQQWQYRFH